MKFDCGVMKVGNSTAMVIPKVLCDNYKIEKGDKLILLVTDSGIFIPLKIKRSKDELR